MADVTIESLRRIAPFTDGMIQFTHYINGNETTGVKAEFMVLFDGTIVDVIADAETAPAGSTSIVDVHLNGTTIFTTQGNRPTLGASDTGAYTKAGEPEVTALRYGDILLLEVDQIGSGTAATRIKYTIVAQKH
jgi:hypothetical protein